MSREAETRVAWEGKWLRVKTRGPWEYVSRTRGVTAVVILAECDGKMLLVEQYREPLGRACIELPAGLVGDDDPDATVEGTALKELEEETAHRGLEVERLGDFHSSPGMVSEHFTLVRVTGVTPIAGAQPEDGIIVHHVARADIPAFVAAARARGVAIDVKLLLLLAGSPGF